MRITLEELVKDIAQAAAEMDCHLNEEYRQRVLKDFSEGNPIVETLHLGGNWVNVPRSSLRDFSILLPQKLELELDTDCILEARPDFSQGPMDGPVMEDMGANCESRADITVSLRPGLDPNASHLRVTCTFFRQPVVEGVAKVTDELNKEL